MRTKRGFNLKKQGFTIVELIIAIGVIGILAAIMIFGYGSWRTSVAERQLTSDLNGVTAAMNNARNFSEEGYPVYEEGAVFDSSNKIFQSSDDVVLTYIWGDEKSYCIEASSVTNSDIALFVNSANGDQIEAGTCPPN